MLTIKNTVMKIDKDGEEIKADDLVEVVGTGLNKHMPEGSKFVVHRIAADNLVAKGAATLGEAVEVKPKKGSDKKKGSALKM